MDAEGVAWLVKWASTLFAAKADGSGWFVLGLASASVMRWYTMRQIRFERNQALKEQQQAFEQAWKQLQLSQTNGHGGAGEW